MFKRLITITFMIGLLVPLFASAASGCRVVGVGKSTPQEVCNWTSYYGEYASGAYYWDLGDGRIQTSAGVTSPDDLDPVTLTECFYRNYSRGVFGADGFLDSGEIRNNIRCVGPDGVSTISYHMVSPDHHRYTGNPDWAVPGWGGWEYVNYVVSGEGNLVPPPGQ